MLAVARSVKCDQLHVCCDFGSADVCCLCSHCRLSSKAMIGRLWSYGARSINIGRSPCVVRWALMSLIAFRIWHIVRCANEWGVVDDRSTADAIAFLFPTIHRLIRTVRQSCASPSVYLLFVLISEFGLKLRGHLGHAIFVWIRAAGAFLWP